MGRLLRLIESGSVDLLPLTTHGFHFKDIEKALRMMNTKEDGMIQPLIAFAWRLETNNVNVRVKCAVPAIDLR